MRIENNTLVMENAGELARMISVVDFWNRRWSPAENYMLQRIPNEIVQELNEAWKSTTEKENE